MQRVTTGLTIILVAFFPVLERNLPAEIIVYILAGLLVCQMWGKKQPEQKLSLTDLSALFCLGWAVLSLLVVRQTPLDPGIFVIGMVILFAYLFMRNAKNKTIPLTGMVIGGLVQLLIVVGQLCGWLKTNHAYYDFTGSFSNPGPLGGYWAIAAVAAFSLVVRAWLGEKRRRVLGLLLIFLLLTAGVVLSDSRAAWLGELLGVGFLCVRLLKDRRWIRGMVVGLSVAVVLGGLWLYHYKKDSADGRLLIWKVSADMMWKKPVAGYGLGAFPEQYMYSQAEYFRNHTEDWDEMLLADNVVYPFNEGIRIGVEQGWVGLLGFVFLLGSVFYGPAGGRGRLCLQALLVVWLIFACFSYPFQILSLAALFGLLVGSLSDGKAIWVYSVTFPVKIVSGLAIMGICVGVGLYVRNPENKRYSQRELRRELKQRMAVAEREDMPELEEWAGRIPSSEVFTELGYVQMRWGYGERAKSSFTLASEMVPGRVMPRYGLFQALEREGRVDSARVVAGQILSMPVKVENTATLRIKAEMKEFLENQKAE